MPWVVGAGGPMSFSADPVRCWKGLCSKSTSDGAQAEGPAMLLDEHYVLFALGLLAQSEPAKALRLMRDMWCPLPAAKDGGAGRRKRQPGLEDEQHEADV